MKIMNSIGREKWQQSVFRQAGVSLVELMIAMAIGLGLVATIGYAYIGAQGSYRSQSALSGVQDDARFAFELIARDLRMAGYVGGESTGGTNVVDTPTWDFDLRDLFSFPLRGYDYDVDAPRNTFPVGFTPLIGDGLLVIHADTESEYKISSQNVGSNTFTLDTWPASNPPEAGELFVAADPTHAAVFKVVAVDAGAKTIKYFDAADAAAPVNTSSSLGSFYNLTAGRLYRLSGVVYFIKTNSDTGETSLYRRRLDNIQAPATAKESDAEELIEGVENMQIVYGVDLSSPADKSVDAYWRADEVDAGTTGTNTMPGEVTNMQERWARVLSVRITLNMVSNKNVKITETGDGLLHKSYTTTLAIRNRLL